MVLVDMLIDRKTKVTVQGALGRHGSHHVANCLTYARGKDVLVSCAHLIGNTNYCRALPTFVALKDSIIETNTNTSLLFVPAFGVLSAIASGISNGISLVVCVTEGVPTRDILVVRDLMISGSKKFLMLGPNCPGLVIPSMLKVGIMPAKIYRTGYVGMMSRSGTLTYEVVAQLTELGIGQSLVVGLGGDLVQGLNFIDSLRSFDGNSLVKLVLMIGEIGGTGETRATTLTRIIIRKPVLSLIVGKTAPIGRKMGHAGALVSSGLETAEGKMKVLRADGCIVVRSVLSLTRTIRELRALVSFVF